MHVLLPGSLKSDMLGVMKLSKLKIDSYTRFYVLGFSIRVLLLGFRGARGARIIAAGLGPRTISTREIARFQISYSLAGFLGLSNYSKRPSSDLHRS